jgi:hypothetical protein
MSVEIERRQSGVWTAFFQPDIPNVTINQYKTMLKYLSDNLVKKGRFNIMAKNGMSCIDTTSLYIDPINQLLNEFKFYADRSEWCMFSSPIKSVAGISHSGQNVLLIHQKSPDLPVCIIDLACHLFGFQYEQIPIAIGRQEFIEAAMSEIYTEVTGTQIYTTIMPPFD